MRIRPVPLAIVSMGAAILAGAAEPESVSGVVQAVSGRFSGTVKVADGKMTVGGRELNLEDTLYLTMRTQDASGLPTNALRMASGEYWRVDILGLSDQAVIVLNPTMRRERRVPLESILALEFAPARTTGDMDQPGTMYRTRGAPLPGSLLWIKDSDVTVQSLLGAIPLPRSSLVCYVLKQPGAESGVALDALRLTDGGLYYGLLGLKGDLFTLKNSVAGTIKVRPDQIRYYSRCSSRIRWLNALPGKFEPGPAPLGRPAAPELIAHWTEGGAAASAQTLRLQPASAVSYAVPATNNWVFQATMAPRASNAGDVLLQIRVDNKDVVQRTLVPGSKPEAVELPLPPGKELKIVTAYGDRLAFPAEVDLCDPIVREAK